MKNLYLRVISRLLVVLGFTALSSCDEENFEVAAEYGVPHTDFTLKIKVTDQDANPVKGIRVAMRSGYVSHLDNGPVDTLYTSDDGRCIIEDQMIRMFDHLHLTFEDIDGQENGGYFKSQEINPELVRTENGDGHWYDGKFEAAADVVLVRED